MLGKNAFGFAKEVDLKFKPAKSGIMVFSLIDGWNAHSIHDTGRANRAQLPWHQEILKSGGSASAYIR